MKEITYHVTMVGNNTRTRDNLFYDVTSEINNEGFRSVVMSGIDINN